MLVPRGGSGAGCIEDAHQVLVGDRRGEVLPDRAAVAEGVEESLLFRGVSHLPADVLVGQSQRRKVGRRARGQGEVGESPARGVADPQTHCADTHAMQEMLDLQAGLALVVYEHPGSAPGNLDADVEPRVGLQIGGGLVSPRKPLAQVVPRVAGSGVVLHGELAPGGIGVARVLRAEVDAFVDAVRSCSEDEAGICGDGGDIEFDDTVLERKIIEQGHPLARAGIEAQRLLAPVFDHVGPGIGHGPLLQSGDINCVGLDLRTRRNRRQKYQGRQEHPCRKHLLQHLHDSTSNIQWLSGRIGSRIHFGVLSVAYGSVPVRVAAVSLGRFASLQGPKADVLLYIPE